MGPLKIFVSHSSEYAELASSLKRSLEALEDKVRLDVKISEEMVGATNWREWIEENVRSADMFLLIYPHSSMEMGWCNYELGRFYDPKRYVASIKNVDIAKPPPAFEPYQAYTGNEDGIRKFLEELFVSGAFTSGEPLNAAVGQIGTAYYARAADVARELSQKFTDARVRDRFYERRIVLTLGYGPDQQFDPDRSTVQGNPEGLNLLGLRNEATASWSMVRASLGKELEWTEDLERAFPAIAVGALPPSLSPFRASNEIYIPVVGMAATVDDVLRNVVLIFVAADTERLRPLLDWTTPPAMPDQFASLIRLVRMMLRARWDILEPSFQEVMYRSPSKARCAEIVQSVVTAFDRMARNAEQQGFSGIEKFYSVFDRTLRPEVEVVGKEYVEVMQALKTLSAESCQEAAGQIKQLLDNNARWLRVAGEQFSISVGDLQGLPHPNP